MTISKRDEEESPRNFQDLDTWLAKHHEEEVTAIAEEHRDLRARSEAISAANRVVRALYHAHEPNAAKAWQRQAGLVLYPTFEPGPGTEAERSARWGFQAMVLLWNPEEGPTETRTWAPTWREAIEFALAEHIVLRT